MKVRYHYLRPECGDKKPVPIHDIRNGTDDTVISSLHCYVKKAPVCEQGTPLITDIE